MMCYSEENPIENYGGYRKRIFKRYHDKVRNLRNGIDTGSLKDKDKIKLKLELVEFLGDL